MTDKIKNLFAIIPARGGSKGLPRKNILNLNGIPLIAHSIKAAKLSQHIKDFVVSTDDDEIAEIARRSGAAVLKRPASLAGDTIKNDDVVKHIIQELKLSKQFEYIALLQPTSPLRSAEDIDQTYEAMLKNQACSAMTITEVDHHPAKCVTLKESFLHAYTNDIEMEARRQTLPTVYRQNGAVYIVSIADFLKQECFFIKPCSYHIVERNRSVDIDSLLDLQYAEILLSQNTKSLGS